VKVDKLHISCSSWSPGAGHVDRFQTIHIYELFMVVFSVSVLSHKAIKGSLSVDCSERSLNKETTPHQPSLRSE
jgi:hypothetical protein